MGSLLIPFDRKTLAPVVGLFEMTGNQLCYINMPDEAVLKAFEHAYEMFREKYIFGYILEDYGFSGDLFGEIEKDDFSELKIIRYKYGKFLVDFSVIVNPQKEDKFITYVYIHLKNTDFKVFCDCYNYKLSEAECEEELKRNILEYIADFYCESVHRIYEVEGHCKSPEEIKKLKTLSTDGERDESIDLFEDIGELPFQ